MLIHYWLSILSLLFSLHLRAQAASSALCFLTEKPAPETLRFAQELADDAVSYDLDVFILIDENNFNTSNVTTSPHLRLLKIPNDDCITNGYQKTISLSKNWREVTAWDKALLYFARLDKSYSFVWLIEEDVFVPSVQAVRSLHELYANTNDLVVPRNTLNLVGNTSAWLWSLAVGKLVLPWSCSMVNVVGFSRQMLTAIDDFIRWLGEVPFHEFFFNTLAIQLHLSIVTPSELSTIVDAANHRPNQMIQQPNNLWHPFKNIALQRKMREKWASETVWSNSTWNFTSLDALYLNSFNRNYTEEHLPRLVAEFEIQKSQFSPRDRRSLRERFSQLAQRCRSQNASNETITVATTLADLAYKLPEPPVRELVKNKSAEHLRLERALKENKETVLNLPWNSSLLIELRKQGKGLVIALTTEIKREISSEHQFPNQTRSSTSTSVVTSSPTSAKTTTMTTSAAFSSTMKSTRKRVNVSYILKEQIDRQISESTEDNIKILFLFLFMLSVLFVLLQLQVFQSQKCYIFILVFALLILFWCIV